LKHLTQNSSPKGTATYDVLLLMMIE